MKTKTFGLFALSIFALVFLMGAVSAVSYTETFDNSSATGTYGDDSFLGDNDVTWTFVNSKDAEAYNITGESLQFKNTTSKITSDTISGGIASFSVKLKKATTSSGDRQVELFINSISKGTSTAFNDTSTHTFTVSDINIEGNVIIEIKNIQDSHVAIDDITWTDYTEEEVSFCDPETIGDEYLTLKVDIENKGEGEDYEWLPLDTIEVDVELENDKNIDLDDIIFEIGFFKEDSDTNIMDDMIWISDDDEEFEYGDIDENDDGKHTFEFRIDPDEVDSGDYLLMVKAYPQGEEDETCIDHSSDIGDDEFGPSEYYAKIEITKESDRDKMVIVDVSEIDTPIKAACGEQIVLSVDVWNIGNRDFEDQIMVSLYNSALGIDLKEVILGDLDEGDKAQVDFVFNVPTDANEKQYTLSMRTYYDYDEGDGKYETDYDRKSEDAFHAYLKVEGNCAVDSEVLISASLESEAKAGKEMVISVLLTNTADVTRSFTMEVSGYELWAELSELPGPLTINADSVGEASLKLDIKKGISGEQTFLVMVYSDNKLIATQPVSVNVESARPFLGITGLVTTDNAYLWGIGLLNIILIIIIILIAVRIARRK